MKKLILALALVVAMAPVASANSTFGFAWNPAVPLGDLADFTSGLQLRGACMEWRKFNRSDLAVGASISWLVFNDSSEGTVTEGPLTITGKRWDYVNTIPLHVTAYKYFSTDRRSTRVFAGLGAGANWMEYRTEVGSYTFDDSQWHFALAPEIGMQLPWDKWLGFVSVRWQYVFAAGDFEAQNWIDFKIGFGLD